MISKILVSFVRKYNNVNIYIYIKQFYSEFMPRINHKSKNIGLYTLTGVKCINPVVTSLLKNIPISIRSKLTPKLFFKVLTSLAIQRLSIHSIQSIGSKIPCESSLHHHLKKIDLELLKEVNHIMFAEQIKPSIKTRQKV
jgi:hypothetical protein